MFSKTACLKKALCLTRWHLALLVQQVQNAHLGFYEVDAGLIIIEVDQSPGDLLLHVLLLLQLEHVLQDSHGRLRN